MFILYKDRTFGEYVSETFDFLRDTGKHFFSMFFTVLGIPLLIVSFLIYYFSETFNSLNRFKYINPDDVNVFASYIENNLPLAITLFVLFFILLLLFSLFIYSFPVLYLKLYNKNKGNNFGVSELIKEFKSNFGRIVIFCILMFFTLIVIMIIAIIPFVILVFTIIGIFAVFFLAAGIGLFSMLSFYIYLNNEEIAYMDAIGISYQHIKKNFWATIGSFFIMYLIVYIISMIFSFIGGANDFAAILTTIQTGELPEQEEFSYKTVLKAVFMILSYIVSYVLSNLVSINTGLIYYSMLDHKENINSNSEIDLIGTQEIE